MTGRADTPLLRRKPFYSDVVDDQEKNLGGRDSRLRHSRALRPQQPLWINAALITGAVLYFYGVASFNAWRNRRAEDESNDEDDQQ
jgi:hypothetical protein